MNDWRSVAAKVNFQCSSYCAVLQLLMNDRRGEANGIVLHQPQDSRAVHARLLLFSLNAMPC